MSNENALFEDDFDTEFDDFANDDFEAEGFDGDEPAANDDGPTPEVDLSAPMKDLSPIDSFFDVPQEGGDRVIPAISINAFCELADTQALLETAARDRRMSRTITDFRSGGSSGGN